MKSSCCKAELIQDVRAFFWVLWIGTKYVCSECGKEYSPEDLVESKGKK